MATYGDVASIYTEALLNPITVRGVLKRLVKIGRSEPYVKELARISAEIFGIDGSSLGWKIDTSYADIARGMRESNLLDEELPDSKVQYVEGLCERSRKSKAPQLGLFYPARSVHQARLDVLKAVKTARKAVK